jgi:hypothetical protein
VAFDRAERVGLGLQSCLLVPGCELGLQCPYLGLDQVHRQDDLLRRGIDTENPAAAF